MTHPASWFDDPSSPGRLRYFDGERWTQHVQAPATAPTFQQINHAGQVPQVQHVQVNQVTVVSNEKSVGVALLLTFFFGPLGMLYSTVVGALVMMGLGFVLGILTLGLWFLVAWPIQMVWAAVAASNTRAAPPMAFHQVQQVPPRYPAQDQSAWSMPTRSAAVPPPSPPIFPNVVDTSGRTASHAALPPRYDPDRATG
jgi:hypothetical protein